ncbi:hypothetical protein QFC20_002996 [Naganishia adeliensis]|uniref:Uncharacterized protein n=1 Tax=Naganishia adeliensis TaxID=92952 RepID=A0ACC2WG45_9TREE|nr:hypothetical protein QFC20_002996 [Naganishia adeliensis]
MQLLITLKGLALGVLCALSFSLFILSIIYTNHQIVWGTGYSAGVVVLLVCACLHWLYCTFLLASGRRGKMNSSRNLLGIHGFFTLWYFAMAVFLTAARYKEKYHTCPAGFVRENSTCGGMYKALMALTWSAFGILVIYLAHVFILAKKYSGLGAPDRDQLPLEEVEMRNVREKGGH